MELPSKIYLFQGLPKSDKMEMIIQKAVELGVYEVIPVSYGPGGSKTGCEKRSFQTETVADDRRKCCQTVQTNGDSRDSFCYEVFRGSKLCRRAGYPVHSV